MKVRVDEELCIGDGTCEELCPQIFEMNEDVIAVTKIDPDDDIPEELEDACQEAVEDCPVEAIIIKD